MNFLMVIKASGTARGHVHTTTTTESRKMAARLQIIGCQRHAALVYLDLPQVVFLCSSCYEKNNEPRSQRNERRSREETTCLASMDSILICISLAGNYCYDVMDASCVK